MVLPVVNAINCGCDKRGSKREGNCFVGLMIIVFDGSQIAI